MRTAAICLRSRPLVSESPTSSKTLEDMLAQDHLDRLASFPLFEPVPRAELEWLCDRGDARTLAPGTTLWDLGQTVDGMWILLTGQMAAYVPKVGTWRKIMDGGPGFVLG